LSSLFNFPSEMTNAAKRAFMKQTKNNQNALRISSYCKVWDFWKIIFEAHDRDRTFEILTFLDKDSLPLMDVTGIEGAFKIFFGSGSGAKIRLSFG